MEELPKKEEIDDKKSPPSSSSQDRGCRCNSRNFPKGKSPGLVATFSSRPLLLVYSDGSSSLA